MNSEAVPDQSPKVVESNIMPVLVGVAGYFSFINSSCSYFYIEALLREKPHYVIGLFPS